MFLEQRQCFRCYLYTNRIRKTEWAVVVERNPRWLQQWCQKSGEAYGQTWQIRVKEHSILIIYGVWDALRDSEVQKPSRETLFSSPGLNVETCDSLALLHQLCVCVCVYRHIHMYMYIDFYGNYNIWLYIYEWRYIWLRKMRRSKTGLCVTSSCKGWSEKQELSEEAESAWSDAWEKTQESRCHRAHGRQEF